MIIGLSIPQCVPALSKYLLPNWSGTDGRHPMLTRQKSGERFSIYPTQCDYVLYISMVNFNTHGIISLDGVEDVRMILCPKKRTKKPAKHVRILNLINLLLLIVSCVG